jgi:hypothetical protein
MTEETERQLLIHNTIGERLCEWGAPELSR